MKRVGSAERERVGKAGFVIKTALRGGIRGKDSKTAKHKVPIFKKKKSAA